MKNLGQANELVDAECFRSAARIQLGLPQQVENRALREDFRSPFGQGH